MRKTLDITHPEILEEWDYEKNGFLLPFNVTRGKTLKVWWKCKICNFSWSARISDRTIKKSGCPRGLKTVTQQETRVFCELKIFFHDIIQQFPVKNFKIDMYIPSLNLGIEVDGYYGHRKSYDRDVNRNNILKNNGFDIIHLRQKGLKKLLDTDIFFETITVDIVKKLLFFVFEKYSLSSIQNIGDSFFNEEEYQNLCREWHQIPWARSLASLEITRIIPIDKKGDVYDSRYIHKKSHLVYEWKCLICNKIWERSVAEQVRSRKCPYCTNKKVSKIYNLKYLYPDLMDEWDYETNLIKPENYFPYSIEEVSWICKKCNLPWTISIVKRTVNKSKCLHCDNKKNNLNSLAMKHPELLKDWDYSKNIISPYECLPQSNKEVFWICSICQYSWKTKIQDRVNGKRCPVESGRFVTEFNCLSKTNPKLSEEWHVFKNILTSQQVTYGCKKKVWWKCSNCDEEYSAIILNRSRKGSGCNTCGFRILPEYVNDSYFHKSDLKICLQNCYSETDYCGICDLS